MATFFMVHCVYCWTDNIAVHGHHDNIVIVTIAIMIMVMILSAAVDMFNQCERQFYCVSRLPLYEVLILFDICEEIFLN